MTLKEFMESEGITDPHYKYPGDWSVPTTKKAIIFGDEFEEIARFGSWLLTIDGDLIFFGTEDRPCYYPICSNQLKQADWVLHLSEKGWFTTECYEDFKRAYFVACKIVGITPVKQIRNYPKRKHIKKGVEI